MLTCRQSATSWGSGRRWTMGLFTFPAGFLLMGDVSVSEKNKQTKEKCHLMYLKKIILENKDQQHPEGVAVSYCCRWFPVCHSHLRSHTRPSTVRRWNWSSGNSCQNCFWLPPGHLYRCHMCFHRWQSSSRVGQKTGLAAYPGYKVKTEVRR